MEEITKHQPGTFSWIDLATTDPEASKKFYAELFGLTAVDTPAGPDMVYTMLMLEDKPVAALYQLNKEQQDQGIPPHWDSYVTVENVDTAVEKVKTLQGTVLKESWYRNPLQERSRNTVLERADHDRSGKGQIFFLPAFRLELRDE